MNARHRLRAWLLNREANQLMERANGSYRQSAHQTGHVTQQDPAPDPLRSPLFALAGIVIAYGAGYVVADDKRLERDQQEQVTALCAQPWPDAPGAIEARRRVYPIKKQS